MFGDVYSICTGNVAVARARPTALTQREPQVADRGGPLVWVSGYNTENLAVVHSVRCLERATLIARKKPLS